MRVLVTGGCGFFGSHLSEILTDARCKVTALDRLTYSGNIESLLPGTDFIYGDVTNISLMRDVIPAFDIVIHAAAETHVMRSIVDNAAFFHTDVLGTHAVAEAFRLNAKRSARLIHISTSEVYGSAWSDTDGSATDLVSSRGFVHMREDQPLDPMGPYAAAKCGADRLVKAYINTYGIRATILRPFNMYGIRQHIEKMIPRFITCVLNGERMPVHGDGSAMRDFTHVKDVSRAVIAVMDASATIHGTYNIASGVGRTVKEVAADIKRHVGRGSTQKTANRPGQVEAHIGDARKLAAVCGWSPMVSWEDGLRDTVNWYAENETFWRRQMRMASIQIGGEDL